MPVIHSFPSTITDEIPVGRVRPAEWNAPHTVSVDLATEVTGLLPASNLVGTDITKVGTVTTGTWNANALNINFLGNDATLRTGITAGNLYALTAWDTDQLTVRTFIIMTAGNTPSMAIAAPAGGSATINNIPIGGTTPAAGAFTTLSASGNAVLNGINTQPNQPAFLAYNSSVRTDITGDGTAYVIPFDAEIFDQNGDFDTSTGTFIAPVTRRYQLNAHVQLAGVTAAMTTIVFTFVTSNRNYIWHSTNGGSRDLNNNLIVSGSVLADMDANDVANVRVTASNGTKVADISASLYNTTFSGFLAC